MNLSNLFSEFFKSEKASGVILIICTAASLLLANSMFAESYIHVWHHTLFSKPLEFWINDGLMTIFFLMVGLEIERELYIGELADIKKSMLPLFCAVGGMLVPALIHFAFNHNTPAQNGFGIPMATDIAFSLAILSLPGSKVPASLKIFLTALAIIDDLGAIIIIAIFYSKNFSWLYFSAAALLFIIMLILNRLKFYVIPVYLLLGCAMWFCMYRTGVHPTISGVLLAFVIPFGKGDATAPSYRLQHYLHKPVAFFIVPLFALANTAIHIPSNTFQTFVDHNSLGIMLGLVIGKPLGICVFAIAGIAAGICSLPEDFKKQHLLCAGFLAGIGFTMSIFIALLAYSNAAVIDASKIAVMLGSVISAVIGLISLNIVFRKK